MSAAKVVRKVKEVKYKRRPAVMWEINAMI